MPNVGDIAAALEQIAPLAAAEEWDNVGLLVGDRSRSVSRLMTCLTITPSTAAEAIADHAEMVVVHHPLLFRPITRITADDTIGRLLWELIGAEISVYSAHTAFDSATVGINQQWAEWLQLRNVEPLIARPMSASTGEVQGAGRYGNFPAPTTLGELVDRVKERFALESVRFVGDAGARLQRVAVACGSGGSFLEAARVNACDCLITGEANFHACLAAEAEGVALVLCGHYASERFAMESLAAELSLKFTDVNVWASRREQNPIQDR
jgi:dinuclear metal center YbgI/SA1388 family protein